MIDQYTFRTWTIKFQRCFGVSLGNNVLIYYYVLIYYTHINNVDRSEAVTSAYKASMFIFISLMA